MGPYMITHVPAELTEQMLHRICSEFAEMPGLQLTSKQAQRLWGLDAVTCVQLLNVLVEADFLRRVGPDKYRRATEGPVVLPRLRMAQVNHHNSPLAEKEAV